MLRIIFLAVLLLFLSPHHVSAQHITHDFRDVTVVEALQYVQQQTDRHRILYICNDLECYRITVSLCDADVAEATAQIIAGLPIRMTHEGSDIYLEGVPAGISAHPSAREADEPPMKTIVLERVEVDSILPPVTLLADGYRVNTSGWELSPALRLDEVLRRLPGLVAQPQAEADTADRRTTYYIDGHRVNRREELEALTAADVRSIRVTYGTGNESVNVSIRTRRPGGEGWSVHSQASYGQSETARGQATINVGYRRGRWEFFGRVDHRTATERLGQQVSQHYQMDTILQQDFTARESARSARLTATVGMDYRRDSLGSAGVRATVRHVMPTSGEYAYEGRADFVSTQGHNGLWGTSALRQHPGNSADVKVYGHGQFGSTWVEAEADWLHDDQLQTRLHNSRDLSLTQTRSHIVNDLLATRMAARRKAWSWDVEYSLTRRDDDYVYAPLYAEGGTDSSQVSFIHHRFAAHAAYAGAIGQRLRLTAGLRYEYSYGSTHLLPHLMLSTRGAGWQASMAYQHTMEYPAYAQLSTNRKFVNAYDIETGNPTLKPRLCQEVSARGSWQWLTVSGSYRYVRNEALRWANKRHEAMTGAVTYRPENIDRLPSLTLGIETLRQVGAHHLLLALGYYRQWLDVTLGEQTIRLEQPRLFGRVSGFLRLGGGWTAEADIRLDGRGDQGNVRTSRTRCTADAALSRTFCDGRLALRLAGLDLLAMRRHETLYTPLLTVSTVTAHDTRRCELTLRYNFNPQNHKYKGKGAGIDERKRLYPEAKLSH